MNGQMGKSQKKLGKKLKFQVSLHQVTNLSVLRVSLSLLELSAISRDLYLVMLQKSNKSLGQ